ncbi:hypothetical protein [Terrisporobacter mayombei]|uniref:Uncharacterized protein n=1 Tax=Terrisporobacter mayombei TaxID=1541 RepID=A0ABY9PZ52_9FIRM|nr:hypothetical protein [Terrisporobacter mayombei]MCC3868170.1 hypothetical protein [Terrisporobacter mayombei]WMT80310.1 hypothetical protein TEMA_06250 [Terrisporobacter mayombei]
MYKFKSLTPVNGLDYNNLENARQNNYCWSMSELDDYIYVGTGRNIILVILKTYFGNKLNIPTSIYAPNQDNKAEIWRHKKDCPDSWEKVFTAKDEREYGFRYMVNFRPFDGNPALYAASAATKGHMQVYKSVNGVVWKPVLSEVKPNSTITGTSSRSMVVHKGKLYLAAIDETGLGPKTLLYSSKDPEFFPWELETPEGTDPNKNPQGGISNMAVFNKRIYVATSTATGVQVWRTNKEEPEVDDWTLVVGNGFGDKDNVYSLSMGVFKNRLYVSGTKELPLAWAIPKGCDIVRIDKNDHYEEVIGPNSVSGIWSGFYNPFNVYAWQIQEYEGELFISTFDDATNMQLILDLLLANRKNIPLPQLIVDILIEIYELVVELLNRYKYQFGFNLYVSENGLDFDSIFLDGLDNRYNYGGRILFVDRDKDLYIGTANPFQGLEVWRASQCRHCSDFDNYYDLDFEEIKKELEKEFTKLQPYMSEIQEFLQPMLSRYTLKRDGK